MRKLLSEIKDYIIIIVVVIIIRTFIVTPAIVEGASMDNTLADGQLVLINKFTYKFNQIERFDIVVLDNEVENDRIIKRIIGLPNEKIAYIDNQLFINNELIKTPIEFQGTQDFIFTTKENEYFVLGDNREVSKDSRLLGNFTKDNIIGKVSFRLLPFKEFGKIEE